MHEKKQNNCVGIPNFILLILISLIQPIFTDMKKYKIIWYLNKGMKIW